MEEKRKIRVLRIINRFNIGGPTFNATFLTRFISDEFETLLVGGLPEEGEKDSLYILEEYGLKPLLIPEMKREPDFFSDRKAYRRIKEIIREFQPDIVHTHAAKAGALGRKAAAELNVPIIVHTFHGHVFHSYFGRVKTAIFKQIERNLAKKSTGIIAISDLQKNELVNIHKISTEAKTEVIQLGFDLEKFHHQLAQKRLQTRKTYDIEDDELAIAITGRLAPVKNHRLFLETIKEISGKTTRKLAIFIVGDGTERSTIENFIQTTNFPAHVRIEMTSWIRDIATFNAGMDIICLTSLNEGTPVSLIEAQAGGVPVISTDVGGVRDVVLDGETGYVVPLDQPALFAEKLLFLIENEKICQKMSQNGWKFVENKFSYVTLVKNMENYYNKLVSEQQNKQ